MRHPSTVFLEEYVKLEIECAALQDKVALVEEQATKLDKELGTAQLNVFYYENLYTLYKEFYFKVMDAYQAVPQDPRRKRDILGALLNVIDEAHIAVYGEE